MNTTGIVILCVLLYLIIFVFSFFSLSNIDDDETEMSKELGKRVFWPIYLLILIIVAIVNFFVIMWHITVGFYRVIKEDIL